MKIVGVPGFRGLWALKWAWQTFFGVLRFVGVKVGVANFFLGSVKIFYLARKLWASQVCRLWALKWAWQTFFWVNRIMMRTIHFS